jgi:prepilin-type N-terminal cleavage/methylation domain-containing protein
VSQNKSRNNRGVTLVEVMIALVIMLVVFMGLIQASLLSIDSNLRNELRDEAVRIGSESMARSRSVAWATLVPGSSTDTTVRRTFRNLSQDFTVTQAVAPLLDASNKQVTITVSYTYRDDVNTFRLNSIVRQP